MSEKSKIEQLADALYERIEQVGNRADNARLALEVWMDTAGVWLRPDDPQPTEDNKHEAQQDWKKFQSSLDALQRSVQEVLKHRHLKEEPKKEPKEPQFTIISLVDLKESMRHTVSNSDLPKYLSAAIKWQRGAPNRIVLVQSVKSGQVLTAEAALAKIQSKKGGK